MPTCFVSVAVFRRSDRVSDVATPVASCRGQIVWKRDMTPLRFCLSNMKLPACGIRCVRIVLRGFRILHWVRSAKLITDGVAQWWKGAAP